jgi:rod shape-determining protein MreB
MIDALKSAGARRVLLVDGPLATALGAKVPVAEPFGNMVVSLGEATCDAAVLSLGGIVVAKGMRWGGVDMDVKLVEYLKKSQNLHIGEQMARGVREKYLCALRPKHPEVVEVSGRDTVYGLPKSLSLNSDTVYEGLKDGIAHIASLCVSVLSQTPPELVGDIMDRGVILTGGLANTRDLAKYLTQTLNVAVHIASEPEICTIRGAGMILENIQVYERAVR